MYERFIFEIMYIYMFLNKLQYDKYLSAILIFAQLYAFCM